MLRRILKSLDVSSYFNFNVFLTITVALHESDVSHVCMQNFWVSGCSLESKREEREVIVSFS